MRALYCLREIETFGRLWKLRSWIFSLQGLEVRRKAQDPRRERRRRGYQRPDFNWCLRDWCCEAEGFLSWLSDREPGEPCQCIRPRRNQWHSSRIAWRRGGSSSKFLREGFPAGFGVRLQARFPRAC